MHEAFDLVQTRSLRLAGDGGAALAIVPVLDMVNHGAGAARTAEWRLEDGAVVLSSTRALAPGDEVRFAYNDGEEWEPTTERERWLVSYGFVPENLL